MLRLRMGVEGKRIKVYCFARMRVVSLAPKKYNKGSQYSQMGRLTKLVNRKENKSACMHKALARSTVLSPRAWETLAP
jgi:hypothetical protein